MTRDKVLRNLSACFFLFQNVPKRAFVCKRVTIVGRWLTVHVFSITGAFFADDVINGHIYRRLIRRTLRKNIARMQGTNSEYWRQTEIIRQSLKEKIRAKIKLQASRGEETMRSNLQRGRDLKARRLKRWGRGDPGLSPPVSSHLPIFLFAHRPQLQKIPAVA